MKDNRLSLADPKTLEDVCVSEKGGVKYKQLHLVAIFFVNFYTGQWDA